MRLLHVITYASLALAVPTASPDADKSAAVPVLAKRATVTGAVNAAVAALTNSVNVNIDSIRSAVNTIGNSVGVDLNVNLNAQALIRADLQAIVCAIGRAVAAIQSSTIGAVGGLYNSIQGLTQAEVTELVGSINNIVNLLNRVRVILTVTVTDLTPAVRTAISSQLAAVEAAVPALVSPLFVLITAVRNASVFTSLNVTGLNDVLGGLNAAIEGVLSVV
jgi:hypothetical protein